MEDQEPEPDDEALTIDTEHVSPPGTRVTSAKHRKQRVFKKAEILLRFQSCGRCGLFLTGYRLQHEPQFEQAITQIDGDWLPLPWDPGMRDLVNKSYGCRTDIETYYLEGTCPECKRPFAYAEPDPEHPAWFVVKI
jgi:hypothetical protein